MAAHNPGRARSMIGIGALNTDIRTSSQRVRKPVIAAGSNETARMAFGTLCLQSLVALAHISPAFASVPSAPCAALRDSMRASHIADIAIAIFRNGTIDTAYCTIESSKRLSPENVFEAASLSKPVFAAGVLKLVSEGKIDLDRPLSLYLSHPYTHERNPSGKGDTDIITDPRLRRVTARMVLSHTSGLPNWARTGPLQFQSEPGERWRYSSEGYLYLQKVVETVTATPLDEFLQSEVLRPLGMTHSSFVWQTAFSRTLLTGHAVAGDPGRQPPFIRPLAPTSLYTTLDDYARFVEALLNPEKFPGMRLEESKQVSVRPDLRLAWGLGVALEESTTPAVFHWGANPGYQSFFLCEPTTGRGVLFFTDSDQGLDLVDPVVGRYVPGPHPSLRFPMLHPKD